MKMIFKMKSGRVHKLEIGDMDQDYPERLNEGLSNSGRFVRAWNTVDGVMHKQFLINVNEIETVMFE
jgi:hypothetical protein